MNEHLKEKHYPKTPPINPDLIATATCYGCEWQVSFADRNHYAQNMAQQHRSATGHRVSVRHRDRSESHDSEQLGRNHS